MADDLGVAMQLTNVLRDVREDLRPQGRVPAARGPAALRRRRVGLWPARRTARAGGRGPGPVRGRAGPGVVRRGGFGCCRDLDRRSAACAGAMAGIYRRLLNRIDAHPADVLDRRLSLPAWEKGWVAARALVRARRMSVRGPESARPRVAVVGGGLAGMTAALACADAGALVTLLESKKWLGGGDRLVRSGRAEHRHGAARFLRCCTAYRGSWNGWGRPAEPTCSPACGSGAVARRAPRAAVAERPARRRFTWLGPC